MYTSSTLQVYFNHIEKEEVYFKCHFKMDKFVQEI